jgi:glycosyltransferase involved in cell wall biosynthesis
LCWRLEQHRGKVTYGRKIRNDGFPAPGFLTVCKAGILIVSICTVYPNSLETDKGQFVRSRLIALSKHFDLTVVAPTPLLNYQGRRVNTGPRRPESRCTDAGATVLHPRWLHVPGGGALNVICLAARLIPVLLRLRPFAIIDGHFGYPEGVATTLMARLFRRPAMITLRGSELLHSKYRIRRAVMKWALTHSQRVIAVSRQLADFALDLGADPKRVIVIGNGVDPSMFFPRDRRESRNKLRMPQDARVIITAGHLIELKGHHYAIRAVRQLLDEGVDVHLYIAGGAGSGVNSYQSELLRLVGALGLGERVHFLGEVRGPDMPELMSAADVFCLASSREGCPNVVREALACGTPVVASGVGAVPELLASDRNGFVVPPRDVTALQDALRLALATPWHRDEIAAYGQSRSWEQVATEVKACVCDLVMATSEF